MGEQHTDAYEVLDEEGHKTGKILDRDTVHKQELWHEVANVWIMNSQGEVLLQLRGPSMELAPNVWDVAIGTHVRPNEDPTFAAQRCLQTEFGLVVHPDKLKHLFNIRSSNPVGQGVVHRTVGHVFLLKQDVNISDIHVDPAKIVRLEWRSPEIVMAEIGSTETSASYFPRAGNYYAQLFDALAAETGLSRP